MTSRSARRLHVITALAAAVAVATLSGCAGTTGSATGSGGPIATSAPAPAPTATHTAMPPASTGVADPAVIDTQDPSSWLITFDGVGPLKYGGSISAGRPSMTYYTAATAATCPTVSDFQADGTAFLRAPLDGETITALTVTGHTAAASPALAVGSPHTTAGVTVGSTSAQLLAAYPGIVQYPAKYPGTTVYSVSDGGAVWIAFSLMEGIVVQIDVTNTSSALDELCG